jgi:hypothetical protein
VTLQARKRLRIDRLRESIARLPFQRSVLDPAFEHFCNTGKLPTDDERLVQALLDRALRGGGAEAQELSHLEKLILQVVTEKESAQGTHGTVREHLFAEAMHEGAFVRKLARLAITYLVFMDGDVCDPAFGSERGLPTHGTVGMHVMDLEARLVKPPYEEQAQRLFRRMDELRARIDYNKDGWWDPIRDALLAFLTDGALPPEGIVGDWVFALVEYDCLWRHGRKEDVAELMAAFDGVVRTTGKRRGEATARLSQVIRRDAWRNGEPPEATSPTVV